MKFFKKFICSHNYLMKAVATLNFEQSFRPNELQSFKSNADSSGIFRHSMWGTVFALGEIPRSNFKMLNGVKNLWTQVPLFNHYHRVSKTLSASLWLI